MQNIRSLLKPDLTIIVIGVMLLTSSIFYPQAFAQQDKEAGFHASKVVAGFHIELRVQPAPIEPGALTSFGTIFRDTVTGEPAAEVPHAFMLVKGDQVIFRESTTSGSTLHEFRFMEEQKGQLTVVIENVNNSGENAEFNLTVIPEFPFSALLVTSALVGIMLMIMRLKGHSLKRS